MMQDYPVDLDMVIRISDVEILVPQTSMPHFDNFFTIYFNDQAQYPQHIHGFSTYLEAKVWHVLLTDAYKENRAKKVWIRMR